MTVPATSRTLPLARKAKCGEKIPEIESATAAPFTYILPRLIRGETVTIRWRTCAIPVVVGHWRRSGDGVESSYDIEELRHALALVAQWRRVDIETIVQEVFGKSTSGVPPAVGKQSPVPDVSATLRPDCVGDACGCPGETRSRV